MNKLYPRLSKYILADENGITIDLKNSHGSWIVDENGKERLDMYSQFASQPLGWNLPEVKEQKYRLAYISEYNIANSDMYSEEYVQFVETFASFAPDFKHFFFIAGGTLGVENALKAAFDWKASRLNFNDSQTSNLDVFHFRQAFHGRSGYSLSLTNTTLNKTALFPKFNWSRFDNPAISLNVEQKENEVIEKMTYKLEKSKKLWGEAAVASIIVETAQSEGGDNHFRIQFLKELRRLADEYQTLLILDEVQTGMCLTGKTWAYEHFDIVPDLICFGKKVQVAGCASTGRIDEVEKNVFNTPSRINSTWGGNLTDMVRSTIYMEIIRDKNLVDNAATTGEYLKSNLERLGVDNVRGRGLMIAFDLKTSEERDNFLKRLSDKILALKCGEKSIRLRPHLTFGIKEADIATELIGKML